MKPKDLLNHIKELAQNSAFYQCEQGTLRIEDSDEPDHFECVDEDTGEMYEILFEDVDEHNDKFLKLVPEGVLENLR